MIDEFKVLEVLGVRGKNVKERISVIELTDHAGLRIELQEAGIVRSVDLEPDAARKLARQLNRIARRVELRNA